VAKLKPEIAITLLSLICEKTESGSLIFFIDFSVPWIRKEIIEHQSYCLADKIPCR
jgi:hypothetical protein